MYYFNGKQWMFFVLLCYMFYFSSISLAFKAHMQRDYGDIISKYCSYLNKSCECVMCTVGWHLLSASSRSINLGRSFDSLEVSVSLFAFWERSNFYCTVVKSRKKHTVCRFLQVALISCKGSIVMLIFISVSSS